MFLFWYSLAPVWFAIYLLSCAFLGYVMYLCNDAYSWRRPGFVCDQFSPVCSLGIIVVTSLVVGFLGYTLELFCNVCNLPVIVNRVNTRWRCLDRIVVASEAIVICLLLSWRDSFSKLSVR